MLIVSFACFASLVVAWLFAASESEEARAPATVAAESVVATADRGASPVA